MHLGRSFIQIESAKARGAGAPTVVIVTAGRRIQDIVWKIILRDKDMLTADDGWDFEVWNRDLVLKRGCGRAVLRLSAESKTRDVRLGVEIDERRDDRLVVCLTSSRAQIEKKASQARLVVVALKVNCWNVSR